MSGSKKLKQKIGALLRKSGLKEEAFLARQTIENFHVRRYHTEFIHTDETVGEHTAGVLMFLIILDGDPSANLMINALLHDFAEYYTGDSPFPAKRDFPALKKILDKAETKYLADIGIVLPKITAEERLLLKAADMLQLCYKARKEIRMGNKDALYVLDNGLRHLEGLQWGCAHWGPKLETLIGDLRNERYNY